MRVGGDDLDDVVARDLHFEKAGFDFEVAVFQEATDGGDFAHVFEANLRALRRWAATAGRAFAVCGRRGHGLGGFLAELALGLRNQALGLVGGFAGFGGFAEAVHQGLGAGFEVGDQGFRFLSPIRAGAAARA